MEITGKIIFVGKVQSGVSKAGNNWEKCQYVLETLDSMRPRKVAFTAFGSDRVAQFNQVITPGAIVKVSYDIESREFNERWYTDIMGWKVEPAEGASQQQGAAMDQTPIAPVAPAVSAAPAANSGAYVPPQVDNSGSLDDLPF